MKSDRITFLLNQNNPKEKIIFDFLSRQYNKSEFIKDLLLAYISNGNLSHDDNSIITKLQQSDNNMIIKLSQDDNKVITSLQHNDNQVISQLSQSDNKRNNEFLIDLDNLEDKEVNLSTTEKEDANKNALDFLKNSF